MKANATITKKAKPTGESRLISVEGELTLSAKQEKDLMKLRKLSIQAMPSSVRTVLGLGKKAWGVQVGKILGGVVGTIVGSFAGGVIGTVAAVIQAICIGITGVHPLNRAEIFLLTLLLEAPKRKMAAKELRNMFLEGGYASGGDLALLYEVALKHLIDLRIVSFSSPVVKLEHKVINLPELPMIDRPNDRLVEEPDRRRVRPRRPVYKSN